MYHQKPVVKTPSSEFLNWVSLTHDTCGSVIRFSSLMIGNIQMNQFQFYNWLKSICYINWVWEYDWNACHWSWSHFCIICWFHQQHFIFHQGKKTGERKHIYTIFSNFILGFRLFGIFLIKYYLCVVYSTW